MNNFTTSSSRLLRCSLALCGSILLGLALFLILGQGTSEAGFAVLLVSITAFGSLLVTWNDPLIYAVFIWLSILLFVLLFQSITRGYTEALALPLSIVLISVYTKSPNGVIDLLLYACSGLSPFSWGITLRGNSLTKDFWICFVIFLYLSITILPSICESVHDVLRERLRNQGFGRAGFLLRLLIL